MEENAGLARLESMRGRSILLTLVLAALVAVAIAGAALQLARGERPVLFVG
jgi:hypothetical protein